MLKKTVNPKNKLFFTNVVLAITTKCNLHCTFCLEPPKKEDFDLNKTKLIIDKLANEKLRRICISGGEPLLNSDLMKLLKYIHFKGIECILATNGTLLTKKKLTQLKPYLYALRISLLGNEQNQDLICGVKGSYTKITNILKYAKDIKLRTNVVSTIIKSNYNDLPNIIDFCEKNNVEKLYLHMLLKMGRATTGFEHELISGDEVNKALNKILKNYNNELKLKIKINDWSGEGQCIIISNNGDIIARPSYNNVNLSKIIGNAIKDNLGDIWNEYCFKKNYITRHSEHYTKN
jgi:MoaA/NifB/PqqE/SkfB family radical SAM enzyme